MKELTEKELQEVIIKIKNIETEEFLEETLTKLKELKEKQKQLKIKLKIGETNAR